ncbi:hypothetical protein K432DRAFT_423102 [Lepidopterella palustris CBS 459.81]|uniref:Uncharacterized protein n=1 Tax=Lepidopterella palustris CBS 459.81 TaxID=1314670 RepID=A0A8E2EHR1_9PEZI|nr:hypothetical protein K432DRAFT_423102 [Lepidopterella palustris CBS 459.81]
MKSRQTDQAGCSGTPRHSPCRSCRGSLFSTPRTANVGIRRVNYASSLLGSPARPSYATRMTQIFRDARLENRSPAREPQPILYPQLPVSLPRESPRGWNHVSSFHTPPRRRCNFPIPTTPTSPALISSAGGSGEGGLALRSLRQPLIQSTFVPEPLDHRPSLPTSSSWSGDSSYLTADPAPKKQPLPSPSTKPRINEWLSDISSTGPSPIAACSPTSQLSSRSTSPLSFCCPSAAGSPSVKRGRLKPRLRGGYPPLHSSHSNPISKPESESSVASNARSGIVLNEDAASDWTLSSCPLPRSPGNLQRRNRFSRSSAHSTDNASGGVNLQEPIGSSLRDRHMSHGGLRHKAASKVLSEDLEEGGVTLSPLSANVTIERRHLPKQVRQGGRILKTPLKISRYQIMEEAEGEPELEGSLAPAPAGGVGLGLGWY